MKDNLLALFISLFEENTQKITSNEQNDQVNTTEEDSIQKTELINVQEPAAKSMRVICDMERMQMTRSSHQLLMRLKNLRILNEYTLELVLNEIILSESSITDLDETKWTVRQVLAQYFDELQLAFLDLVLYQKEYDITCH